MKMNKLISVAAAAALATSMVSICASAASFTCTDSYAPEGYLRLVNEKKNEATEGVGVFTQAGLDQTSVYGFKITLEGDVNAGVGGGCGFNSNSTGWKSMEWGNADAGKELSVAEDNTITYLSDAPVFAASDVYCHIWIQCWWQNADVVVTSVQPLDASGNPIDFASAIEASKAAEETTAETEAAEETTAVETEAVTEEVVEETVEEAVEEEVVEEEAVEEAVTADVSYLDEGTKVAEGGTCANWGQAVVMYTYNNIAEGEEAGENPFDESQLNADNAIVVTYESANAPELILQSWSGGEGWAKVPANETYSTAGTAVFTYDYMTAMYQSEDFATLDAVNVGDTGADLTVTGVYVVPMSAIEGGDAAEEEVAEEEEVVEIEAEVEEEVVEEAVEETVEEEVTATPDSTTSAAATGNASLAAIASVIAVAGAAAVAARKRK